MLTGKKFGKSEKKDKNFRDVGNQETTHQLLCMQSALSTILQKHRDPMSLVSLRLLAEHLGRHGREPLQGTRGGAVRELPGDLQGQPA